ELLRPMRSQGQADHQSKKENSDTHDVTLLPEETRSFDGSPSASAPDSKRRATPNPEGQKGTGRRDDADRSANAHSVRKANLLMPSALIFASSVERGMPSLVAAPEGPATRPCVSASADSMITFSVSNSAVAT